MKLHDIKHHILQSIENGDLTKGQRLPSCRELAKQLSVNKITVNLAYRELEAEHRIYGVPRGGFYVAGVTEPASAPTHIDFKSVTPDRRLVPYRELGHVIERALEQEKNSLFLYEPSAGMLSLREALQSVLADGAVYTKTASIVITNGIQQALYLLLQMLFAKNATETALLVEAPTYGLVLKMAQQLSIPLMTLPRTKDGYDLKKLEKLFASGRIKAFYLMPRHHNPTGFCLSEKQKSEVARLAGKYQILLIEDDFLSDLGTRKGCLPLHYYDTLDMTIYLRSFSKVFMPGLRIGAAILPERHVEAFTELKMLTDLNTSRLSQSALDLFLRSGMYQRHLGRVRACYEEKLRRAEDLISALSPDHVLWHVPKQGIFIWAELQGGQSATGLATRLSQRGVWIAAGTEACPCPAYEPPGSLNETLLDQDRFFRLCVSGLSIEDLKTGLGIILEELREMR